MLGLKIIKYLIKCFVYVVKLNFDNVKLKKNIELIYIMFLESMKIVMNGVSLKKIYKFINKKIFYIVDVW